MNDADRVSGERAQARRAALSERADQAASEEAARRSDLLTEISNLAELALDAQKAADYPALETVEVTGPGERQRGGFKLAKFWLEDRGSAITGTDYLLGDGTFATRFEGRALVLIKNWDQMSVHRLEGIRDGIQRLSSTGM